MTLQGLHHHHFNLSHHHLSPVFLLPFLIPYILLSTQPAAKEIFLKGKSDLITLQGSLKRPFLSVLSKITITPIYPFILFCLCSTNTTYNFNICIYKFLLVYCLSSIEHMLYEGREILCLVHCCILSS